MIHSAIIKIGAYNNMKKLFYGFCFITLSAILLVGCVTSNFYPSTITGTIAVRSGSGAISQYSLKAVQTEKFGDVIIQISDSEKNKESITNTKLYQGSSAEIKEFFKDSGFADGTNKLVEQIVNERYTGIYTCYQKSNVVNLNDSPKWEEPSEFKGEFTCISEKNNELFISVNISIMADVQSFEGSY